MKKVTVQLIAAPSEEEKIEKNFQKTLKAEISDFNKAINDATRETKKRLNAFKSSTNVKKYPKTLALLEKAIEKITTQTAKNIEANKKFTEKFVVKPSSRSADKKTDTLLPQIKSSVFTGVKVSMDDTKIRYSVPGGEANSTKAKAAKTELDKIINNALAFGFKQVGKTKMHGSGFNSKYKLLKDDKIAFMEVEYYVSFIGLKTSTVYTITVTLD